MFSAIQRCSWLTALRGVLPGKYCCARSLR
uniref:Uncharacterized protein n=1 Tax=Myoviridae sp. ctxym25 TaxID=2825210 RepID=A0A8S5QHV9_9CAUD|nr:MAG TPA: hypothetical protein [Myoviridae sp. ctxym25]